MPKPETRFSKSFRKKLPSAHDVRVENSVGPGTPDLNYCINGVEGWIEFKQVPSLPKREDTPVFTGCLKPEQVLWHIKRTFHGGRSYIVAAVVEEGLQFVVPGALAKEFNSMTLKRLQEVNLPPEAIWRKGNT